MLIRRILDTSFQAVLNDELRRRDMTVRELADATGIPAATLYKITAGERDPRLSTVTRIINILEPRGRDFIAVVAAKFVLEEVEGEEITCGDRTCTIKGYSANSLEECIIAAVRAEKEGASGIVCAPVLASIIERIVDIPVSIMKPQPQTIIEAIETLGKRIS